MNKVRNNARLKHTIMGANIWSSLISSFHQLWYFIHTEIHPLNKVCVCALKEEIEAKSLHHFGMDVKAHYSLLVDTHKEIIRKEGTGKYNVYILYMFKTYFSSSNVEFNESIKDVKRRWTQDLLNLNHSYLDLISTAAKTYNNIVVDWWTHVTKVDGSAKKIIQKVQKRNSWHW